MASVMEREFEQYLAATYPYGRPGTDEVDQLRSAFYGGSVITLNNRDIAAQLMQEHYDYIAAFRLRHNLPAKVH